MRPWLAVPGSPGIYEPLPQNVAFPATRGELSSMNRRDGRALAAHLRIDGAATMERVDVINAIAKAIGFVIADVA